MSAGVAAEATGRIPAVRLSNATCDRPLATGHLRQGHQDGLGVRIARDTMHRHPWLAIIEDTGGLTDALPAPDSFGRSKKVRTVGRVFMGIERNGTQVDPGSCCEGPSIDGTGQFRFEAFQPLREEPCLGPARPNSGVRRERMAEPSRPGSKT
ncbi:hypothetical protein [Methylobacterium indicum]|uniref:hypothetical protein n=1 Tax=Methylobacterium indicum TaxID=1775910 RepID=UPI0007345562